MGFANQQVRCVIAKHIIKFALFIRHWRDFHPIIYHALKGGIFGFKADNIMAKGDNAFIFEGGFMVDFVHHGLLIVV